MTDYPIPGRFVDIVHELVALLIGRSFVALERRGWLGRVEAEDLARVLDDYPARFVELPEGACAEAGWAFERGNAWLVEQALRSAEEGRSDLVVSLILREGSKGSISIEINDLLVP